MSCVAVNETKEHFCRKHLCTSEVKYCNYNLDSFVLIIKIILRLSTSWFKLVTAVGEVSSSRNWASICSCHLE